jgi:hypothetical protein
MGWRIIPGSDNLPIATRSQEVEMSRLTGALLALPICTLMTLATSPAKAEDKPVEVRFRSVPNGALVVVNGKDNCTAPCKMELLPGTHVVGMSHDNCLAREEMVEVSRKTGSLKWELKPHLGTLSVATDPDGQKITVGQKGGKSRTLKTPVNGLELEPGVYQVSLASSSFAHQERDAEIRPGEETRVVLETVPTKGALSITVLDEAGDPDKATITLNGKRYRGAGPWSLKPGTYRVKVKHRRKLVMDQSIEVEAGSDIALDVQTAPE